MSIHEKIKEILIKHRGKRNALKSPKIAKLVGVKPGASTANIRTLIKETILKYKLPIAGNPALGYYLIANKEELREYQRQLDSRAHETLERKAFITTFYYLFYEDEEFEITGEVID